VLLIALAVLRRSRRSGSAGSSGRFGFRPRRSPGTLIETPDPSAPTPMKLLPLPCDSA